MRGKKGVGRGNDEEDGLWVCEGQVLYCVNILQYINGGVSQPPQGSAINVIRGGGRDTETGYAVSVMGQANPFSSFPRKLKSNKKVEGSQA